MKLTHKEHVQARLHQYQTFLEVEQRLEQLERHMLEKYMPEPPRIIPRPEDFKVTVDLSKKPCDNSRSSPKGAE